VMRRAGGLEGWSIWIAFRPGAALLLHTHPAHLNESRVSHDRNARDVNHTAEEREKGNTQTL
jgi:hypothetical protein